MQNGLKRFGAKDTDSFNTRFRRSLWKLTFLYVMVLAVILLVSSSVIYTAFSTRLERRYGEFQIVPTNRPGVAILQPSTHTRRDVQHELIYALIFVNGILLIVAGVASHGLALITLQPLKESYESQRRFLADASHELRTPVSILKLSLENEITDENTALAQRIRAQSHLEEVDRMSNLVSDLLTLSRLGEQKPREENRIKPVNLSLLITGIFERLTPLAKKNSTTLTMQPMKEDITIVSDEEHITTALTNIVKNAIVYNKKGGTVDIQLDTDNSNAIVKVRDSGIGIPPNDLTKIFERFYRTDKSRSRTTGGSGLGLSIVRASIQKIGGTIAIDSTPDHGTTVTVHIPLG